MIPDYTELAATLARISESVRPLRDEEILQGDATVLDPLFRELDILAAQDVEPEIVERLLYAQELASVLPEISRLRNLYSLRLEIQQARSLLENSHPWQAIQGFTFYPNYVQLAATEQQGANLQPGDRVIFLGSGPLPLSLILLCSEYGLNGLGIERDQDSAEFSRHLLEHLGMQEQISILVGDHFTLHKESKMVDCKLVMVAAMARPKQEIFRRLARILPADSLVSYRLYEKGLRRILDQEEDFLLPDAFSRHCRIPPRPPVNNTVVMVRKHPADHPFYFFGETL
ncbi:MAG: nicotianamine synthase family protein [Candidatus Electrothrix aestuarii]|uniref:Nicotianamine synthase family protein n=1 Tax=Candidatus Electrothrix aestuarii TaxID=3062594 RepID=A0AAU8LZ43_9BACT|nr:nicotianamine synthase family protein [Candidatus Electrothrix aestuarii]